MGERGAPRVGELRFGSPAAAETEVVERKGRGHPDTLCDGLAEAIAAALEGAYAERLGRPQHYNVDKVALVGGESAPRFGGGRVLYPMELIVIGRASPLEPYPPGRAPSMGLERPVGDAVGAWLSANLRHVRLAREMILTLKLRPGSGDLAANFEAGRAEPRANDTSVGVGFAPLSPVERLVLDLEARLQSDAARAEAPEVGEDVKVLAVRRGEALELTVAAAMVAHCVESLADYRAKVRALEERVSRFAAERWPGEVSARVNAADAGESVYLTVTGCSAEAGDDGAVGRGNRWNGLITPGRPMTMEAYAGKNARSHTGRIYQIAAQKWADALAAAVPDAEAVVTRLVSRIGAPVTEPALASVEVAPASRVAAVGAVAARALERAITESMGGR